MNYTIQTIVCGAYQENAYLLCPEGEARALLIDPGDDLPALSRALADCGRALGGILLTHGHFDHTLSAPALARESGAPVYIHPGDAPMLADARAAVYDAQAASRPFEAGLEAQGPGELFELCGLRLRVLHTPGHSAGSVCYYDEENGVLFSGDTLFCAGFGRMDLPGGSPMQMRASLLRLFELPGEVRVLPGHGGETSISAERGRYRL